MIKSFLSTKIKNINVIGVTILMRKYMVAINEEQKIL